MMNSTLPSLELRGRRLRLFSVFGLLLGLALALSSTLASAAPAGSSGSGGSGSNAGGGSASSSGSTLTSSPGEDIGTLPFAADAPGLTFVGELRELAGLRLRVQGRGQTQLLPLPRGGYALTFSGNYLVELDRAALVRAHVAVLVRSGATFTGGTGTLVLGDEGTRFESPRRLPLPLAALAQSPDVQGRALALDLAGAEGQRLHLAADFGSERVALFQRLRP